MPTGVYPRTKPTKRQRTPLRERFDAKWTPEPNTGCWLWIDAIPLKQNGYGRINVFRKGPQRAHRIAWELYRGPIPRGLVVDHICRVRSCVNPDHLRVVTRRQNALENTTSSAAERARQTHCKHGHPLAGSNVRPHGPDGRWRECVTCANRRFTALTEKRRHHKKPKQGADKPRNDTTQKGAT